MLEWSLWTARWGLLAAGLLAQAAALACAAFSGSRQTRAGMPAHDQTPPMHSRAGAPADGERGAQPCAIPPILVVPAGSVPAAPGSRLPRGLLLTGCGLVGFFALLERDALLLAGQALTLPLIWSRLHRRPPGAP